MKIYLSQTKTFIRKASSFFHLVDYDIYCLYERRHYSSLYSLHWLIVEWNNSPASCSKKEVFNITRIWLFITIIIYYSYSEANAEARCRPCFVAISICTCIYNIFKCNNIFLYFNFVIKEKKINSNKLLL